MSDKNYRDPRAKWDKLRKFEPHQKSKLIHIPTEDLRVLCLQNCHVLMSHFNVLARISSAYEKDCKEQEAIPEQTMRLELFRRKGLKIYKTFYEPRLDWFHCQRDYCRYLRQDELYYKNLVEEIKLNQSKIQSEPQSLQNIHINESLPIVNSEDFLSFPTSCTSTQIPEEEDGEVK